MNNLLLLLLLCCTIVLALWFYWSNNKLRVDVAKLRAVVNHQHDYTFLVNDQFEVNESNVPIPPENSHLLGNVLHCRNVHETGSGGEGGMCKHCPLRFVIGKSFERGDDFSAFEASMELERGKQKYDVDVRVDGRYVNVATRPYMVVNVKEVTGRKGAEKPRILFISENPALFDRVRKMVGTAYRIMGVDNDHQAVHRLKHVTEYRFCAVITDTKFYSANTLFMDDMTIPVFVFTKGNEHVEETEHVKQIGEQVDVAAFLKLLEKECS